MLRVQLLQQTMMACFLASAVIPSRLLHPTVGTELASNATVLNAAFVLKEVKTQKTGKTERKNEPSNMNVFVPCIVGCVGWG